MNGIFAAIDFGTACCSVAYCTENDQQAIQNLDVNPGCPRVPTALLLSKQGENKYAVERFGAIAQEQVLTFGRDVHKGHRYFEFFKMHVHQKVSREKGRQGGRIQHNDKNERLSNLLQKIHIV